MGRGSCGPLRGAPQHGLGVTALADHVAEVVAVRGKEQVGRVNAQAIVATVTDAETGFDVSDAKPVGNSVGGVNATRTLSTNPKLAVAKSVAGPEPYPTIPIGVELDNFGPEASGLMLYRIESLLEMGRISRGRPPQVTRTVN